ncbi:MAG: FtsX-like permease family protein [Microbacterium enclense]
MSASVAARTGRTASPATGTSRSSTWAWLREPGMGATILVGAISTAFGVILLSVTEYLAANIRAQPILGDREDVQITLAIATSLLVGLSIYVGAIVTTNTFATVVAGRTRRIALLRLLGSSARRERGVLARQGLILGTLGAVIGSTVGLVASIVGLNLASDLWHLNVEWSVLRPDLVAPAIAVILVTWAAAWVGSRRVGVVTPLQALSNAVEPARDRVVARRGRHVVATVLVLVGAGLLTLGVIAGGVSQGAVLIAFAGGALSFTGVILGSALFLPPVLRAAGVLFGRGVVARMAASNALRHSERSSRTAIGVVMGVTLVTMFAVAAETSVQFVHVVLGDEIPEFMRVAVDIFTGLMIGLVGVSAVIAAVGVINLLVLGILQRQRELGLLRALGLSVRQVRTMVVFEAAHVVVTSVVIGFALGTLYGWAGAQSLLGWMPAVAGVADGPVYVAPAIPVTAVVIITLATAALTIAASVVPARTATRLSPVRSLAAQG